MAKFSFFITMTALLMAVSTARPADTVLEEEINRSGFPDEGLDELWVSPAPGYEDEYVENIEEDLDISPSPPVDDELEEFEKYVEKCARVIGDECGKQIFYAIFEDKSVNATCCDKLVQAGLGCSDVLVKSALQFPELNHPDINKAYENSAQVYYQCTKSGGQAPSPAA